MIATVRQRGVALITAMLIFALLGSLALSLAWDNQLDMRRTMAMLFYEEGVQAALGAESWVQGILRQDLEDSSTDHLGEIWATDIPALPLVSDTIQGELFGTVEDLQGRFNVNNLIDENGVVDVESLEQFRRLLAALGLDPRFAGIAADWLDADRDASFPDGAEDPIYTGLVPPYRTANQSLTNATELAALEGMDKASFDTLLPHIVALPGRTAVNVNTATAVVLQSLGENVTAADVERLLAEREDGGFPDIASAFSPLVTPQVLNQLEETTDYFQLKVVVRIATVRITYFSIFQRAPGGDVIPILRSFGTI